MQRRDERSEIEDDLKGNLISGGAVFNFYSIIARIHQDPSKQRPHRNWSIIQIKSNLNEILRYLSEKFCH